MSVPPHNSPQRYKAAAGCCACSVDGATVRVVQPEGFGDLRAHQRLYHALLVTMMTGGIPEADRREIAEVLGQVAAERDDPFMAAGAHAFVASAAEYIGWFAERERERAAYRAFFRDWDVLLTPAALVTAFRHDSVALDADMDDRVLQVDGQEVPYMRLNAYAGLATLGGQPATVFPAGLTPAGLPIGLQVIGPYLEDHTPLRFAALLAAERGGAPPPPAYP